MLVVQQASKHFSLLLVISQRIIALIHRRSNANISNCPCFSQLLFRGLCRMAFESNVFLTLSFFCNVDWRWHTRHGYRCDLYHLSLSFASIFILFTFFFHFQLFSVNIYFSIPVAPMSQVITLSTPVATCSAVSTFKVVCI